MIEQIAAPGGKSYNLSTLTVQDLIAFKSFLKYASWHGLYNIRHEFPEEMVNNQLEKLFEDCANVKITEDDMNTSAFAIEGARELLYLSLKKNHEDITREDCGNILSIGNLEGTIKKLLTISNLWEEEKTVKVVMLKDYEDKKKDKTYTMKSKDALALMALGIASLPQKKRAKKKPLT